MRAKRAGSNSTTGSRPMREPIMIFLLCLGLLLCGILLGWDFHTPPPCPIRHDIDCAPCRDGRTAYV
jgi:hypothetical protein